ncbi:MAG: TatD family hydrolase [Candidatus Thorarchaeota archaeon]|nr:MAG: TatD family hydrolase [Candidatus Thorarchaeota archaeon]
MELFDAHTHLDMKHFKNDLHRVLERARAAGVQGLVNSSIGPGSFRRTLGIVKKYPDYVYHSPGCSVSQLTEDDADAIDILIRKYKDQIVAIGEVGLDYHWVRDSEGRKAQEPLFVRFIDLADELNLPLVVHSRKAEAEALRILERQFQGDVLMHCFDGTSDSAKKIRDLGWKITLPTNFRKYRNRVEATAILPLEQILLETDGPYLSPTEGRNEPANLSIGCTDLADLLGQPVEDVAKSTTQNSRRFYGV